jgi:hypothetical protein
MKNTEKEAYDSVMAALLNSECHPRAAVTKALEAVTRFALAEGGLSRAELAGVAGGVVWSTPAEET